MASFTTARNPNAAEISDELGDADAILQALQTTFSVAQDLSIAQSAGISLIIETVREKLQHAEEKL